MPRWFSPAAISSDAWNSHFLGKLVAALSNGMSPDCVTLEVGREARAPDSEVVADRLDLLASAVGVRRSEVVELGEPG